MNYLESFLKANVYEILKANNTLTPFIKYGGGEAESASQTLCRRHSFNSTNAQLNFFSNYR